jgi:NADH:ubiquinone oxidoreductase subunit E
MMDKNSIERTLLVCCGTGCIANGAQAVAEALEKAAAMKKTAPLP